MLRLGKTDLNPNLTEHIPVKKQRSIKGIAATDSEIKNAIRVQWKGTQ